MTLIIDYGSGNLHSAAKAFERAARESGAGDPVRISSDPKEVLRAERVVLPGVGAFADCRAGLERIDGMLEALEETARHRARPFLGICVGMQLMAERGLEHGDWPGLGWIASAVERITPNHPTLKIPHMGWNTLETPHAHPLFDGIPTGPDGWHAYFVHSYAMKPKTAEVVVATTDYGGSVVAAVAQDNLAGTQFHPEKSQRLGLKLIANFLHWSP